MSGSRHTHIYRDELVHNEGVVGARLTKLFMTAMEQQESQFSRPFLKEEGRLSCDELVARFLAENGDQIFVKIVSEFLADDKAVERYVSRSIRHWLINDFKKTPDGRLYDLLVHRMNRDKQKRFIRVKNSSSWALREGNLEPCLLSVKELVSISQSYPITMTPWTPSAGSTKRGRLPNIGKRGELESMLEGLFTQGDGSLETMMLVHVLKRRVPEIIEAELLLS